MSNIPALSGSPITFVDVATGKQYQIPLSLLSYSTAGALSASFPAGTPLGNFTTLVNDMLTTLENEGLITEGPSPAPAPALAISARTAGSEGNGITVTFANPNAATSVVDVTVTVRQTYAGLSLGSIGAVLGTSPTTGSAEGLVYVTGAVATTGLPPLGGVTSTGTEPTVTWPVPATGTLLFTLAPRNEATGIDQPADVALITVSISNIDTTNNVFTLTVTWTKSQLAVPLTALQGHPNAGSNPFAYVVTFAAPSGGTATLPAAGSITLAGGVDAVGAAAAAAATGTALV